MVLALPEGEGRGEGGTARALTSAARRLLEPVKLQESSGTAGRFPVRLNSAASLLSKARARPRTEGLAPWRSRWPDGHPGRGGWPHEINLRRGQAVGLVDEVAERALQFQCCGCVPRAICETPQEFQQGAPGKRVSERHPGCPAREFHSRLLRFGGEGEGAC